MNLQQIITASTTVDLVEVENGKPVTTSLKVAEYFGKDHRNVIRDIRDKVIPYVSEKFNALNFELVTYTDAKGEQRPMYKLTRDGFTMVAMGYTGAKAMKFKEDYITAFNHMEDALRGQPLTNDELVDRAAQKVATQLLPQFFKTIAPTLAKSIVEQVRSLPQGVALLPPTQAPTPQTKKKRGQKPMRYVIYTWNVITTPNGLEAVDKQVHTTTDRAKYMDKLREISRKGLQFYVEREALCTVAV